jgi:hypothetical protein
MSGRALPEGVERYDLETDDRAGRMVPSSVGRYFRITSLPAIEAHLATRLQSEVRERLEKLERFDPEFGDDNRTCVEMEPWHEADWLRRSDVLDALDAPKHGERDCKRCEGLGKTDGDRMESWLDCPDCDGTGKEPAPGPTIPEEQSDLTTRLLSDDAVEALAKARYEREEIPHAGPWDEAPPNSRLLAGFREDAKQDLAAISTVIGKEAGES